MQTVRRVAAVLICPLIAWLGAACERTEAPTKPSPPPAALELSSSSTTRWVNDDDPNGGFYVAPGTSCNDPGYQTVQAAVNAAGPGDRINVCAGTYTEEVLISGAGKNNISLRSVRRWDAVIKAPAVMLGPTKSIVLVNAAQNVTILAFTITGPSALPCDGLRYGVRVDGGGSAAILGNHITQIRDEPFSGCQNGVAVQVGRLSEGTTGSAQILGNVIDHYQKNGPTVSNAGSHAEIAYNRIFGVGPTAVIAQNGIQASGGATAEIRHNFVSGNIYTPQTFASTGILLFTPGDVLSDHNTLTSNDVGLYVFGTTGSNSPHNRVRGSTFDGLILQQASGNQAAENRTDHNNGPGIGVYDSQDNSLDDNMVEDNAGSGILLDNGDNNTVGSNKVRENGTAGGDATDGIRLEMTSSSNTVHDNRLKHNVTHDCHDNSTGTGTAGTDNSWINNDGTTSNRTGLCGEDDNDADFETSTMYGWDAAYPWYDGFGIAAAEYDFATAYATIDTESLLQLLPQIRLAGIRRATPSPNQ
jgi:parallel beta-helix repeat protein